MEVKTSSLPSSNNDQGGEEANSCCCRHKTGLQLNVNKRLLPLKLFYFLTNSALACVIPYVIVYTKQKGLSSQESGLLFGMMPFFAFLAQPIIGMVADRWKKHLAVIMTATLVTGVFHVLLTTVPSRIRVDVIDSDVMVTCNPRSSVTLTYCGYDPFPRDFADNRGSDDVAGDYTRLETEDRSSCLRTIGDFLAAMSVRDLQHENPPSNIFCEVICPISAHRNASELNRICLMNTSHTYNLSDVHFTSCGGRMVSEFPEVFAVQTMRDLSTKFHSRSNNYFRRESENNTVEQCGEFEVTSFDIKGLSATSVSCEITQKLQCRLQCTLPREDKCPIPANTFPMDQTFWLILAIYFVAFLAYSPIIPLTDAACYSMLQDQWRKYGRQRVWGTIGWLLAAVGNTIGVYLRGELEYRYLFYFYGVMMAVSSFTAYFIDIPKDLQCGNMFKNIGKLVVLPKVLALLTVALMFGMMMGALGFQYWYLEDLGAPPQIFGPVAVMAVATEIPSFFMVGRVIQRFGPTTCLCVGVACMSLRQLGFALLSNPWFVLLTDTLHGIAFSLVMASATTYMSWVAPPGLSATSQGLFGAVMGSLGRGVGVILAGWMIGVVGPRIMFASYAAAGICVSVMYALLHCCVFKTSSQPAKELDYQVEEKAGIQDRTTQNLATSIVVLDEEKTPYDIRDQGKATLTSTYTRSSHADRPSEAHDPLLNGVGNNADI